MHVHAYVLLYVPYVFKCLWSPRTALESLDLEFHTGVRCQVGAGTQIPILFLQKQQMLLTTEPPL